MFAFIDGNNKTAQHILVSNIFRFAWCMARDYVYSLYSMSKREMSRRLQMIQNLLRYYLIYVSWLFHIRIAVCIFYIGKDVIASSIQQRAIFSIPWNEQQKRRRRRWRKKHENEDTKGKGNGDGRWILHICLFLPLYISVGFLLRWHIMDSLVNAFHVPLIHIHIQYPFKMLRN